jgi:hypothetical protein
MTGALRVLGVLPDAGPGSVRQWQANSPTYPGADGLAPTTNDGLAEYSDANVRRLPADRLLVTDGKGVM